MDKEDKMATTLRDNYDFYLSQKKEIEKKYANKFILISKKSIVGAYLTQDEAISKGQEVSTPGEYLVKLIVPGFDQPIRYNHWVSVVGAQN